MGQEHIVRYWHAVELLQPQSAPKAEKRTNSYGAFIHDTRIADAIPPWSEESIASKQELPKQRVWSHTLFAHVYDSRLVAKQLEKVFGADQGYKEPQHRESALFAVKFNMAGHLVEDSFVLSSEAWFLGRVLEGKDWSSGFEDDQRAIGDHAKALLEGEVTGSALHELTTWILDYIGVSDFFGDIDNQVFRFRSRPINPQKPEREDDPLNSFMLDDLSNIADSISKGEESRPLEEYLCQHNERLRLHVDDKHSSLQLIKSLMPDTYPLSCWPSEQHRGLVHSQQLAVNTTLAKLSSDDGLLGINGPPGTGKTTLLRDLIASIVTSRANVLARLGRASDGFVRDGREEANDGGKKQACFKLDSKLYGFEIVVASSNNGAVENITLELPQRDKIDESWLPEAEYFSELGELVSGQPAWGLISGALGSKSRRTKFVERYFYGQRPFGSAEQVVPEVDDKADLVAERDAASSLSSTLSLEEGPAPRKDHADMPRDKEKEAKGLLEWLSANAKANKTRSPAERQALWKEAVQDFETAKDDVRKTCAAASRIRDLIQHLCQTREKIKEKSKTLSDLESKLGDTLNDLADLDTKESRPASIKLKKYLDALGQHQTRKPSFWVKLFSLWRAQRDWEATDKLLKSHHDLAKSEFDRIARQTMRLDASRKSLETQVGDLQRALQRLKDQGQAQEQDAINLANTYQANHLLAWLKTGSIGHGEPIELAEPWQIEGWRQSRAQVFIQALKLHRMFFELEASRIRSNLFLINGILTGSRYRGLSREAIRSAWTTLFMVVPVLSSTFASFSRSFGSLGASDIGWLFVDEAGQAPPQAAVGALWRARRALMVGDPLQLKPIVTVSDAVLEHMRTRYQIDAHWLPNRQSAQTLADGATPLGRMAGPADDKTWVGMPLVVHRRCDKPMHELANRVAYDGAMVFGTIPPNPDKETPASLPTGWIQAIGTSEGNWVPAEGQALKRLLTLLKEDGVEAKDISVITPFKAVRENLKRMLRDKLVSGTIHTMQGKEAAIIIMVLGGNTESSGARNWVVSEPNLLNVAATRAKRRFYVIGDRGDWQNRALFCDVMDLLPLHSISTSE